MDLVSKWFGFGRNEHYDRGLRAYEQGRYDEAIAEFQLSLEAEPDPALRQMARSHMSSAYAHQGRTALQKQDYHEAERLFKEAIDIEPHFADLRLGLSMAYRGLGDTASEDEQLACALEINANFPMAIMHKGILLYGHGKWKEGLEQIEAALKLDKRLDEATYKKGLTRHQMGDHAGALERFHSITLDQETDANVYADRADALAAAGQWREAEDCYRKSIALAPAYADVRCRHGQALLELNEVDSAIEEFRRAININTRYAQAHAMLGVALRRIGDDSEAEASFHQAIEIDPRNAIALRELDRPWRPIPRGASG